jgi:hypothetical protein
LIFTQPLRAPNGQAEPFRLQTIPARPRRAHSAVHLHSGLQPPCLRFATAKAAPRYPGSSRCIAAGCI